MIGKRKLAAKNLKVIVDLPPEALTLRADGTRLEEVLHNLLDNAVKFSREKTCWQIHLQATRRGSEMVLSVADDVESDQQRAFAVRIFERFYRAGQSSQPRTGRHRSGVGHRKTYRTIARWARGGRERTWAWHDSSRGNSGGAVRLIVEPLRG